MTGEDQRSNMEKEEEESKLGFEHLVSDLRLEIIARLCESVNAKSEVRR